MSILNIEQQKMIKNALESRKNVIITGMMGSGRSTVLTEVIPFVAENLENGCIIIDELKDEEDYDYINLKLNQNNQIVFTSHLNKNKSVLETFPKFKGIRISVEIERNGNRVANVSEV